jgi:formate hydrogenlyase subunit 6/NADH:ubiquinone oxidoreductase subunit I
MFDFLGSVLKNVISKPATRMYPFEQREAMKDARGALGEIEINKCIFCGICATKCPSIAIKVDKTERSWEFNRLKCIVCNVCVETCPVKCLHMDAPHLGPLLTKDKIKRVGPPKPAPAAKAAESVS